MLAELTVDTMTITISCGGLVAGGPKNPSGEEFHTRHSMAELAES
jgi:hypothetical protein